MPFPFLAQLAISAAFFVIGELLRPKPEFEDAQAVPYEDVGIPSNDPNKKQPVIWGKVDLRGPHIMDFVYYNQVAIKEKVKTGLFSSSKVIVGYRYFVGMQLGLCRSLTTVHKIWVDDRSVPFSTYTDSGDSGIAITVNQPNFLGGKQNGGGVIGTIRVYKGSTTQNPNAYLGAFRTDNPRYNFAAYAVLENVEVGESPNISNWAFQVSRYPDPLGLGANNTIGNDINPMSIVYELLTAADYGFSINSTSINASTFAAAAATLKTEGNGMSLKWVNNESVERLIDSINQQVNGVLRFNPTSGLWEYKLVRDDFVIGNLKVLDDSNIVELASYARASWDETINQVEVTYSQLDNNAKPSPALAHDQSNYIRQQRQKILRLNYPGCYSSSLAATLAARELKINAFPLSTIEFTADRSAFGLLPGDPFIFTWSELGINQLVMRVGDVGFGSDDQMLINISAVEDVFSNATATFVTPPSTGWSEVIETPQALATFRVQDSPYIFSAKDTEFQSGTIYDQAMTLAIAPQNNATGYDILVRQGSDPFIGESSAEYLASGTLQSSITESQGDELATLIVENVVSPQLISTAVVTDADITARQQNFILVVSTVNDPFTQQGRTKYEPELMAYEDASYSGTTVTLTNVHRGLADTLNAGHAAGDRVWFITGDLIQGPGRTETLLETSGEAVDVRLLPIATTGEGAETATQTVTGRIRAQRPYPGARFRVNNARYPTGLVTAGGDIVLDWKHRDRTNLNTYYQDDSTNYGASNTVPETGFEYVLDIYDDTGTAGNTHLRRLVASGSSIGAEGAATLANLTGNNNTYTYTNALQITDGGPFPRYRLELRVRNSAGTVFNLIDVIRLVSVDIPLDLLTRGKIYQGIRDWNPLVYLTTAETSGNLVDVMGTSSNWTVTGTIGYNLPGPDQFSKSLYFPGTINTYASVGDETWNDFNTSFESILFSFWFRCTGADPTNLTPIFFSTAAATNASPTASGDYICYLDTAGRLLTIHRSGSNNYQSVVYSGNQSIDDGRWHHIVINWLNGGYILVDGQGYGRMNGGGGVSNSTRGIFLGGHNDTTTSYQGLADMEISNFAIWEDRAPVDGASGIGNGTNADLFQNWMHDNFVIPIMERHPYLRAVASSNPFKHFELNNIVTQTYTYGRMFHSTTLPRPGPQSLNYITTDYGSQCWQGNNNTGGFIDGPLKNSFSRGIQNLSATGFGVLDLAANTTSTYGFPDGQYNNVNGVIDTDASICCWVYVDVHSAQYRPIVCFGTTATGQRRAGIGLTSANKLMYFAMYNSSNGALANGYIETSDFVIPTGRWFHVGFSFLEQNRAELFIDGAKVSSTATLYGGGGATYSYEWIRSFGTSSLVPTVLSSRAIVDGGDSWNLVQGKCAHLTLWNEKISDEIFARLFAAGVDDEPSVYEMLLSDGPNHVIPIESDTDAADLLDGSGSGQPTATGTFINDTLPLDSRLAGKVSGVETPLGFNGGERLAYGFAALSAKSTTDLDDVTFIIAARNLETTTNNATVVINNDQGTGEDTLDGNQIFEVNNTNDEFQWKADPKTGGTTTYASGTDTFDYGQHGVFVFRETGNDSSKDARIYKNGRLLYSGTGLQNEYNGAAVDRLLVGNRNTSNNQFFKGTVGYVAAYDRAISPALARRVGLRYLGIGMYETSVLQHGIQFLFMCDESDWNQTNVLFNAALVPNKDISVNGQPNRANLATGGPAGIKLSGFEFLNSNNDEGVGVVTDSNFSTLTYPIIMGGWFKCNNTGADAFISISNDSGTSYISVGIFGDVAGAKVSGTNVTSGAVTNGEWAHVMVLITAVNSTSIYLNGEFQTTITTSLTLPSGFTSTGINGRTLSTGTELGDGSYAGVFWGANFTFGGYTTQAMMEIYCSSISDFYTARVLHHSDVAMYYPLSEFWDGALRFHDAVDRTNIATGAGLIQGVIGIIPQHKKCCVDFDGTGNIDTARTDYPASTTSRVFECWIEDGYEGVICSMGANTDAQSFTVGVSSTGQLHVHIRGTGNERIFNAGLSAGGSATEHHVVVELLGDSLHDVNCYVDGVLTSVSTAGTDTILATTATEVLLIGSLHANLTTLPATTPYADGNGKLQGFAVYDAAFGTTTTESATEASAHYNLGVL